MKRYNDNALRSVLKSVNKASGLPNRHYTDNKIFNKEKNVLFFEKWCGIGFGKDIPNLGDAAPVNMFGLPLLILRENTNRIRVFENICQHRGMKLIQQKCNLKGTIRCPYHSWCYGLDGKLRATPHIGGPGHNVHQNIKKEDLGLKEIRSYFWHDIIFVNINGEGPDFEKVHEKLLNRWKDFNQPFLHSGEDSTIELAVNCNWKLAVENFCESYHLPWVHPGLNSYSKLEDHYNIEEKGYFSGQGSYNYNRLKGEKELVFDDFINLSNKWQTGAEYISVFPNVLVGVHRDHTIAVVLLPQSTKKTIERIEIHYASARSLSKKYSNMRKKNTNLWKEVFEEDISVIEGMQEGRAGILFNGGKFSPVMDTATHVFHQWVASNYIKG